jgi:hypothetical protein
MMGICINELKTTLRLVCADRALVRYIDAIQEFTDVFVPYTTNTLD